MSKKLDRVVTAMKDIGEVPAKEARVLAKRTKVVRLRKKDQTVIIRGPRNEVLGWLRLAPNKGVVTMQLGSKASFHHTKDGDRAAAIVYERKCKKKRCEATSADHEAVSPAS